MEIAGKTLCVLSMQDGYHLVPCIHFLGSSICFTVFDRGGSISTHAFDIHHSPKEFLHILLGISFADYSSLGFDMLIGRVVHPDQEVTLDDEELVQDVGDLKYGNEIGKNEESGSNKDDSDNDSDNNNNNKGDEHKSDDEQPTLQTRVQDWRKWLNIVDKEGCVCKIWLKRILSISDGIPGQGTTVWEGVMDIPRTEEAVVVKDSWINPLRKYTKGMILQLKCTISAAKGQTSRIS